MIRSFSHLLLAAILVVALPNVAQAQTASQKQAAKELERQLLAWQKEGREDDIKIAIAHKNEIVEQVKAGQVDLQAILDNHNYNHKDGKYYGQSKPSQRTSTRSGIATPSSTPSAPAPSVPTPLAPNGSSASVPTARVQPADVPRQNRPVAAYADLVGSLSIDGQYLMKMELVYVFPNGNAVDCANWDPRTISPTTESVGTIKGCDITRETPDGHKKPGFRRGETLDIRFGNVSGISFGDGSDTTSTSISGSTLRMTKDGRIAIGNFSSFSSSGPYSVAGGGKRRQALVGRYALDGHLMTVVTDGGETHVGFISRGAKGDDGKLGHIYVNGRHYWDRSN